MLISTFGVSGVVTMPKPNGEPTWEEARPWVTAILIFYAAVLIALGYAIRFYGTS